MAPEPHPQNHQILYFWYSLVSSLYDVSGLLGSCAPAARKRNKVEFERGLAEGMHAGKQVPRRILPHNMCVRLSGNCSGNVYAHHFEGPSQRELSDTEVAGVGVQGGASPFLV